MSGTLGLSSPWARDRIPEALRAELEALVPDGYTVGVSVLPNNGSCRVWVNRGSELAVYAMTGYDTEARLRVAIHWARRDAGLVAA